LFEWYDKRIVNVNVNVILAGGIALVITLAALRLLESTGTVSWLVSHVSAVKLSLFGYQLKPETFVLNALTLVIDIIADVLVYYLLHWIANHMPRKRAAMAPLAYADLSFMRDASLVQFERALLSPVLYVIALLTQNKLLHEGFSLTVSTSVGFAIGLAFSRTLHTIWMIRAERRAGIRSAADIIGPDPVRVTPPAKR